jgi:hypothetical protein
VRIATQANVPNRPPASLPPTTMGTPTQHTPQQDFNWRTPWDAASRPRVSGSSPQLTAAVAQHVLSHNCHQLLRGSLDSTPARVEGGQQPLHRVEGGHQSGAWTPCAAEIAVTQGDQSCAQNCVSAPTTTGCDEQCSKQLQQQH